MLWVFHCLYLSLSSLCLCLISLSLCLSASLSLCISSSFSCSLGRNYAPRHSPAVECRHPCDCRLWSFLVLGTMSVHVWVTSGQQSPSIHRLRVPLFLSSSLSNFFLLIDRSSSLIFLFMMSCIFPLSLYFIPLPLPLPLPLPCSLSPLSPRASHGLPMLFDSSILRPR